MSISFSTSNIGDLYATQSRIKGERGNFIVTKHSLIHMGDNPSQVGKDVEEAIEARAKELGQRFIFSVKEINHKHLGPAFLISWRPDVVASSGSV